MTSYNSDKIPKQHITISLPPQGMSVSNGGPEVAAVFINDVWASKANEVDV